MKLTHQIGHVLGIEDADRQAAIEALFQSTERHPATYWLQLIIAAGIAHFGLVLNSTAVVIGAMLVSPLMTPIVQLGVAFAVGNIFFAGRAAWRLLLSMLVVVLFAALMTKTMPFQEITNEIQARIQPTALDLIVALFCGLAASFTTAKGSKDTVTAAAGTAIAIALVPPLCVVGFGVGSAAPEIVYGASLLFVANLAAIILISDLFFLLTGFADIDVVSLEKKLLEDSDRNEPWYRFTRQIRLLTSLSRSKTFRILLPTIFVGVVLIPLSDALTQVAWEVNSRKAINQALNEFEKEHRVLSRSQQISPGQVSVALTIVGEPGTEQALAQNLTLKLAAASGVEPSVALEVIPSSEFMDRRFDSSSSWFRKQLADLGLEKAPEQPLSPEDTARTLPLSFSQQRLRSEMGRALVWLRDNDKQGEWLGWSLNVGERSSELVLQRIADSGLDANSLALFAAHVQRETGIEVKVSERRVTRTLFSADQPLTARIPRGQIRTALTAALAENALGVRLMLCDPQQAARSAEQRQIVAMNNALQQLVAASAPAERTVVEYMAKGWRVELFNLSAKPIPAATPAPVATPAPAATPEPSPQPEVPSTASPPEPSPPPAAG